MNFFQSLSQVKKILNIFTSFSLWVSRNIIATILGFVTITLLITITLGAVFLYYKIATPLQKLSQKESVIITSEEAMGKNLNESIDKNKIIDSTLKALLINQGADRAYLFRFHDGTVGINGDHFFYMSNTNEVVSLGTSSEMENLQRQPLSMINDWTDSFDKKECITVDVDSLPDTEAKKSVLERQGIKRLGACPIFSKDFLVGFIGVDFTNSPDKKFSIDRLGDCSEQIGIIISTH